MLKTVPAPGWTAEVRSLQGRASSYNVVSVASSLVTWTAASVTGPVATPAGAIHRYA